MLLFFFLLINSVYVKNQKKQIRIKLINKIDQKKIKYCDFGRWKGGKIRSNNKKYTQTISKNSR